MRGKTASAPETAAAGANNIVQRPTWRNFIRTAPDYFWCYPNMAVHEKPAPDNDGTLEGYADAAAFLGISVEVLKQHEERLRIPRLVLTPSRVLPGQFKRETVDARTANMRKAPPLFTRHALALWEAVNDPYAPGSISTIAPGTRGKGY